MNESVQVLSLAGQRLRVIFEYEESKKLCAPFLVDEPQDCTDVPLIRTGEYERRQYLSQFPDSSWNSYAEMKCLMILASDALLQFNRLIFHSAAFIHDGRAWLLSGPSGSGKSTHYRLLKTNYSDDIKIISGDNPVLCFGDDDRITVNPSPWNGKEGWGSMRSAPLAGIIMLDKSFKNKMTKLSLKESVIPVFKEMNTYARNKENLDHLFRMEEIMISSVPVYLFQNIGNKEASYFLLDLTKSI